VSIQKGTMADFRNVQLNGNERTSTPYYVQLRVTALSSTPPPKDSDPAITFTAIDDRGQQQQSITFLGTFSRCDDPMPPKQFVSGNVRELPGLPDPWRRFDPEGPVGQRSGRGQRGDPLLRPSHRVGLTTALHSLPQEQSPGQAVEARQQPARPAVTGDAEAPRGPRDFLHLISTAAARRLHPIRLG
jgi:hypothetical protein